MYVLTKGTVRIIRRIRSAIAPQSWSGNPANSSLKSDRPTGFVDVHAIDDVQALLIPPEKALILRRVALIEAGTGGPVLDRS